MLSITWYVGVGTDAEERPMAEKDVARMHERALEMLCRTFGGASSWLADGAVALDRRVFGEPTRVYRAVTVDKPKFREDARRMAEYLRCEFTQRVVLYEAVTCSAEFVEEPRNSLLRPA